MTGPDVEDLIFKVESSFIGDPIKARPIRLARHRYETHITRRHAETAGRISDIENTIRSPHYVANCVSGPGNKHSDGVCFVRVDATPETPIATLAEGRTIKTVEIQRTSYMHVMVQSDAYGPYVATALFSDNYHGDVIWIKPGEEQNSDFSESASLLDLSYDAGADILYISDGEPVAAYSVPGQDGLLLRYAARTLIDCCVS